MPKIGIITILKVNNYGAELQAYATQAVLNRLGYDAEIIDYLFYKNPFAKHTRGSRPDFPHPLKKRIAEWIYPLIHRQAANDIRSKRFENFHKINTRLSPTYRCAEDLYDAKMLYDVYMVGSDQVWNPGSYTSLRPYFLDFAPKGKPRVAYASSFGVSELPKDTHNFYKTYLNNFNAIGVRERTAVEMVKNVSGKDAEWVLDPTLLLNAEDWSTLAKPIGDISEPYVLVYELTPCDAINKTTERIASQNEWKIVRLSKSAKDIVANQKCITDAGPSEFLYLFQNAEFIVTNSFHGTAFAINFGRQFLTIVPSRKSNNSRQKDLLTLMNLTDRMLSDSDPMPDKIQPINYQSIHPLLEIQRNKSITFLKNAIGE